MTAPEHRLTLALAAALGLHALLLFGPGLPQPPSPVSRTLSVTLSTAPAPHRQAATTIATADQIGPDAVSRHARPAPQTSGGGGPAAATGTGGDERSAPRVIDRTAQGTRGVAGGGQRRAGGVERGAEVRRPRRETAVADLRARYLEDWRRTVEAVGNRAFPLPALDGAPGEHRLTLEVTLARDGSLVSTRVRRGSGIPALDAAARGILRDAAPFAPFPDELATRWPRLTFAYDWRFRAGRDGSIGIGDTAAPPR